MKVVINSGFGGFSISLDAARHMAAGGCEVAKKVVEEFDTKTADPSKQGDFEQRHGLRWYGYLDVPRNSPHLVAAVPHSNTAPGGIRQRI